MIRDRYVNLQHRCRHTTLPRGGKGAPHDLTCIRMGNTTGLLGYGIAVCKQYVYTNPSAVA